MPENSSDRLARAAGRAARAFRENQSASRAEQERHRPDAAPLRERVGRAAGTAARDFRERQAEDGARLQEVREQVRADDDARVAERRAARERALDERDAAEAGLVHPLLRLARIWWIGVAVVLAGLGGAFLWNGRRAAANGGVVVDPVTGVQSVGPLGGATGQYTMGGVVLVLALVAVWAWIGLLRRRRSAVGTATFLAVLLLIPAILRPNILFLVAALLVVVGAVLVWLPPVRSRVRR